MPPVIETSRISRKLAVVTVGELRRFCHASRRHIREKGLRLPDSLEQIDLILKSLKHCEKEDGVFLTAEKIAKLNRLCKRARCDRRVWNDKSLERNGVYFKRLQSLDWLDEAPEPFLVQTLEDLRSHPLGAELLDFAARHRIPVSGVHIPACADSLIAVDGLFHYHNASVVVALREVRGQATSNRNRAYNAACLAHELRHAWQYLDPLNAGLIDTMRAQSPWHDFFRVRVTEADAAAVTLKINAELLHQFNEASRRTGLAADSMLVPYSTQGLEDEMDDRFPLPLCVTHEDMADVFAGTLNQQDFYETLHYSLTGTPDFAQRWQIFVSNMGKLERQFLFAMTRYMSEDVSYLEGQFLTNRHVHRNLRTLHMC